MIDVDRKIGAIEGNSFSGKTTLVEEIARKYGFAAVWEPNTYVSIFPVFPPDSYNDAKMAIDYFIDVERRRSNDVRSLVIAGKDVIMDRSLWTYSAFQYVVMKRMPQLHNSYLYSLDVLQHYVQTEEIVPPTAIVNLVPRDYQEFQRRMNKRGKVGIGFLNDWETTILMESWFGTVISCMYGHKNWMNIRTNEDVEKIAVSTNKFLQESDIYVDALIGFDNLRLLGK